MIANVRHKMVLTSKYAKYGRRWHTAYKYYLYHNYMLEYSTASKMSSEDPKTETEEATAPAAAEAEKVRTDAMCGMKSATRSLPSSLVLYVLVDEEIAFGFPQIRSGASRSRQAKFGDRISRYGYWL
jgi:hypothetical protein